MKEWEANKSQEMEQERLVREKEEAQKAERAKKIKEQFGDANGQWEKDKFEMQNLASKEKAGGRPGSAPGLAPKLAKAVDGKARPGQA